MTGFCDTECARPRLPHLDAQVGRRRKGLGSISFTLPVLRAAPLPSQLDWTALYRSPVTLSESPTKTEQVEGSAAESKRPLQRKSSSTERLIYLLGTG